MAEFKLPEVGENVDQGDLVKLLVKVGDTVEVNQPVLELETEKAAIEVPSSVAGKVTAVNVKEGQKVKVGETIFVVEDGASAAKRPSGEEQAQRQADRMEPEVEAKQPKESTAAPAKAEAPAETPAPKAEPPKEEPAKKEAAPPPEPAAPQPQAAPREKERPTPTAIADHQPEREPVPAAPSVRRFAREIGVDIYQVRGSGPGGRISQEDVMAHAKGLLTRQPAGGGVAIGQVKLPDFSRWGQVERQPMRSVRRTTAERLAQAWVTVPHVTQHDKADITDLEALRQRYAKEAEAIGAKITVTAIALKVCAAALKKFPQFAASIDMQSQEIIFKRFYHIGIAVDTDRGLLVPVIRDVDKKGVLQLAKELGEISQKARDKRLTMEEMEGGVFTITNLGGIGGTSFTPIVNAPEVAILGMSRSSQEPVYRNGQFEPRLMLPLSLSYDHRIIDGADAARFLRFVAEALEQPFVLALHG